MPKIYKKFLGSFAISIVLSSICGILADFELIELSTSIIIIFLFGNAIYLIIELLIDKNDLSDFKYDKNDYYFLILIIILIVLSFFSLEATPQIFAVFFILLAFLNVYVSSFIIFLIIKIRDTMNRVSNKG